MSFFDPTSWRRFDEGEMSAFLKRSRIKNAKKRIDDNDGRNRSLVLQGSVSPFDVYTYLHARFGKPNGIMTMIANDDSDNLFHWDYNLKAGSLDLIFIGATQEVHVKFGRGISDVGCSRFIKALKADFSRVAVHKGSFAGTLEKWRVFPNQFLTIANRCGELYATIERAVPKIENLLNGGVADRDLAMSRKAKRVSRLLRDIMTVPTELSVLTPIMFESFVGLLVAVLIKPDFRADRPAFNAFIRSPLNVKLVELADRCRGFTHPLNQSDPAFGRYWTVVNRRNDVIHGNVDPVRDALEVIYFHGKRPLYQAGGDRIRRHWQGLMRQYRPREVMDDYLAAHTFILDILDHLNPKIRPQFERLMEDTQPGWDDRRKVFGILFPDHVATALFEGLRYDWEL